MIIFCHYPGIIAYYQITKDVLPEKEKKVRVPSSPWHQAAPPPRPARPHFRLRPFALIWTSFPASVHLTGSTSHPNFKMGKEQQEKQEMKK